MFSGECAIKSSTKLSVKEAQQYQESLLNLAFPWASAASENSEPPTNLHRYVYDVVTSVATRSSAFFSKGAEADAKRKSNSFGGEAKHDDELSFVITEDHVAMGALWAPILYRMMITDFPEVTCCVSLSAGQSPTPTVSSASGTRVEKAIVSGSKSSFVNTYVVNGSCLSFDTGARGEHAHQPTLFFYLRARYVLEKLLLRCVPRLAAALISSSSSTGDLSAERKAVFETTAAFISTRGERRFRRHLHHALFANLVLTRPCLQTSNKNDLPPIVPSLAVGVIDSHMSTFLFEGKRLMCPAVGIVRVAGTSADAAHAVLLEQRTRQQADVHATVFVPGHSFPFAVGSLGAELYSYTLNALKKSNAAEDSSMANFYFGEETAVQSLPAGTDLLVLGETAGVVDGQSSAPPPSLPSPVPRLGFTVYKDQLLASTPPSAASAQQHLSLTQNLSGCAIEPLHTAFDGLWELFWANYCTAASAVDGVSGEWLVPSDLQLPQVITPDTSSDSAETAMVFSVDAVDVVDDAPIGTVDLATLPYPRCPETMEECFVFALAESVKELQLQHRTLLANEGGGGSGGKNNSFKRGRRGKCGRAKAFTGTSNNEKSVLTNDGALKVPIIALMGLYIKRHSPRIPLALRSAVLGGASPSPSADPSSPSAAAVSSSKNSDGEENDSDEEEDGGKKMSKADKMAKRKAEKDAKKAEKGGGKGGKRDKKGAVADVAATPKGPSSADPTSSSAAATTSTTAQPSSFAIDLDIKHTTYKKATAFLKEIASKTNGAYFTVPDENEIHFKIQKNKIGGTILTKVPASATSGKSKGKGKDEMVEESGLDLLREHKRNYSKFIERFHIPLIEGEEARQAIEEFAAASSSANASFDNTALLADEAKTVVSSISQFYGLKNNVVGTEIELALLGRWRPAASAADKKAAAAAVEGAEIDSDQESGEEEEDEEGSGDDDDDPALSRDRKLMAQLLGSASTSTASGNGGASQQQQQQQQPSALRQPTALRPLIGAQGKKVYNKPSLLQNLRYYIEVNKLVYADEIAEEPTASVSDDKEPKPEESKRAIEAPGPITAAGVPIWQRALLRREEERKKKEAALKEEEEKNKKVTAPDAKASEASSANNVSLQKKMTPLLVHLDKALIDAMRVSATNNSVMDLPTFFKEASFRMLMPQTCITCQSPHRVRRIWVRSELPMVRVITKKRAGNRSVQYVVGLQEFGLSLKAIAHAWKNSFQCSVAIEPAPPQLGLGGVRCLVLSALVTSDSILDLGIPSHCISMK